MNPQTNYESESSTDSDDLTPKQKHYLHCRRWKLRNYERAKELDRNAAKSYYERNREVILEKRKAYNEQKKLQAEIDEIKKELEAKNGGGVAPI
jgi:hypothetical protein